MDRCSYASMASQMFQSSLSRVLAPRPPASDTLPNTTTRDLHAAAENDIPNERPAKRRRVACQRCRLSKLRCETPNGIDQPCLRCVEQSLSCNIDTPAKRGIKRATLNEPEAPDTRPEEGLPSSSSQPSSNHAPVAASEHLDGRKGRQRQGNLADRQTNGTTLPEAQSDELPLDDDSRYNDQTDDGPLLPEVLESRSIESITIEPDLIQHLFNVYFIYYHPLFPVLPPVVSPDAVFKASPFLFWTVICTAARHDSTDFSLLPSLLPALKTLMWSNITITLHTLPCLQAMAILCVWTFPESSMPIDITFVLAGTLKAAAMHAGLHRPEVLTHYSRTRTSLAPRELREAVRVWCCIYVAIDSVAIANGHPPFIVSDQTIEKASSASNPYDIPKRLHQMVLAQMFCNKVHAAMSEVDKLSASASHIARTSLLGVLDTDLQTLEKQMDDGASNWAQLLFSSATLQLRAYWIFIDEETLSRRDGIMKAFNTALQFIEHEELCNKSVKELPYVVLYSSMTAAVLISKVIHSTYGQYLDAVRGKKAFNTCISIFKQSCVEDNDMYGRVTKVLPQLWSIHSRLFEQAQRSPTITLKSRLFFSISHDGLWQWREKYSGQPSNGAPNFPPPLMSPTLTATSARSLPDHRQSPASRSGKIQTRKDASIPRTLNLADTSSLTSTTLAHSLNSPPNFTENTQFSTDAMTQQEDHAIEEFHTLSSSAAQFDMLFPEALTGYTSWLYD